MLAKVETNILRFTKSFQLEVNQPIINSLSEFGCLSIKFVRELVERQKKVLIKRWLATLEWGCGMYEIAVEEVEKPFKIPEDIKKKLVGISPKLLSKMKREAVECPVLGRKVPFIECYVCPNFLRRVKGFVHCKGLPLR